MSTESNGATVYTACFYCDSEDEFHGTVDEHDVAEFHCHKCEARFTVSNWSEFFNDSDEDEQVIGANAKVKWLDTGEVVDRYFSFGDIKDDAECDEYGIPDTEVFFYCGSEQEFEALQSEESGEDFVVLEYELVVR